MWGIKAHCLCLYCTYYIKSLYCFFRAIQKSVFHFNVHFWHPDCFRLSIDHAHKFLFRNSCNPESRYTERRWKHLFSILTELTLQQVWKKNKFSNSIFQVNSLIYPSLITMTTAVCMQAVISVCQSCSGRRYHMLGLHQSTWNVVWL